MTPSEAARILTLAACYDGRTVGEADAIAWASLLGDLSGDAALEAVKDYYRKETRRIMPADLIAATRIDRDPWASR